MLWLSESHLGFRFQTVFISQWKWESIDRQPCFPLQSNSAAPSTVAMETMGFPRCRGFPPCTAVSTRKHLEEIIIKKIRQTPYYGFPGHYEHTNVYAPP